MFLLTCSNSSVFHIGGNDGLAYRSLDTQISVSYISLDIIMKWQRVVIAMLLNETLRNNAGDERAKI